MKKLGLIALTLSGFAAVVVLMLFTASAVLVATAVAGLIATGRMMTLARPRPVPVPVRNNRGQRPVNRVWNDGRGTIIDM